MKDGKFEKGDIVMPEHQMRTPAAGCHAKVVTVYKDGFCKLADTQDPPRFTDRNSQMVFNPKQLILIQSVAPTDDAPTA